MGATLFATLPGQQLNQTSDFGLHPGQATSTDIFDTMDKDLDNANPTILSAAQMPTRQSKREAPKTGPFHKFDDVIFAKPWYLSAPFCDDDSLWSEPEADQSHLAEEPIDEQEIYGEDPFFHIASPILPYCASHDQVLGVACYELHPSLALSLECLKHGPA